MNGHRGLVPSNFLQALPDDPPAERPPAAPAPEPRKESQVGGDANSPVARKTSSVSAPPSFLHSLILCCHLYFAPFCFLHGLFFPRRSTNELCTLRRDRKCSGERHLCFPVSSPFTSWSLHRRFSSTHSLKRHTEHTGRKCELFTSVCVCPSPLVLSSAVKVGPGCDTFRWLYFF